MTQQDCPLRGQAQRERPCICRVEKFTVSTWANLQSKVCLPADRKIIVCFFARLLIKVQLQIASWRFVSGSSCWRHSRAKPHLFFELQQSWQPQFKLCHISLLQRSLCSATNCDCDCISSSRPGAQGVVFRNAAAMPHEAPLRNKTSACNSHCMSLNLSCMDVKRGN